MTGRLFVDITTFTRHALYPTSFLSLNLCSQPLKALKFLSFSTIYCLLT
jgi:hypothetical protein